MPKLIVDGNEFNYPNPGTEPGWGPDATDWAIAVTDALTDLQSPGEFRGSAAIVGGQTNTPVNLLEFDAAILRAVNITYSVTRSGNRQSGIIYLNNNSGVWEMNEQRQGDVGVEFSVNLSGQVLYTSSVGATGDIKFFTKALSI